MQQLYGYGAIDKRGLEKCFGIVFDDYFGQELAWLGELAEQGLVIVEADAVRLTEPLARLLVRVVAAVFDRSLPAYAFREGLQREIAQGMAGASAPALAGAAPDGARTPETSAAAQVAARLLRAAPGRRP